MNYRQQRADCKEARREGSRFFARGLGLLVAAIVVLTLLNYAGVFGHTVVEREVFENSHQYVQGRRAEIALFEAQLAKLRAQLLDPKLDPSTRANTQAQIAALEIQLDAARAR